MVGRGIEWGIGRIRSLLAAALAVGGWPVAAGELGGIRWIQGGAGSGTPTEIVADADARGAGCGSQTLTQSNDPDTIGNDSVWCGSPTANADTSLARAFVAPSDLLLDCVQFGVRANTGAAWPVQVRVLQGTINTPYAQLVELAATTLQIPAGTGFQFFSANFSNLSIAAGTSFVVELRTTSRLPANGGDNALLSLGCNGSGQTAPSYLRGPACGADNFLPFSAIGFGHLSLVMSLGLSIPLYTEGTILCDDGTPLANCNVTITYYDAFGNITGITSATTDSLGYFIVQYNGCDPTVVTDRFFVQTSCCPNQLFGPFGSGCAGNAGVMVCDDCDPPTPTGDLFTGKFRDDDCDGVWDSGEPSLSGWELIITNEDTGAQFSVIMGVGFVTVPYGNYVITEVPQPGFRAPCQATRVTVDAPQGAEGYIGNCPCPAQDFSLDVWCGVGWQVVSTPPGVGGLGALPRPVSQVAPHSAWDPNVCWMSATPNGNVSLAFGTYVYEWCFCLDERFSNPLLDLCVKADDSSAVYLNGVLIGNGVAFNQPGCGAVTTADTTLFRPGQNCIQIVVNNAGGPTGVSVSGIMLADDGRCCFQECPCVPPPANMTGWWMLDEIGGPTAFDSAGVQNNGAHTNGPTFAVGRVNAARLYDGVNDYTEAPDHPELNVGFGPFTVDAWIRTIDGTGVIASKFSAQTTPLDRRGYQLSLNGGNLMLSIWSGPLSGGNYTFVGPSLADGRWHHVAASAVQNNPNGAKLYVDGVPQTFPIVGVVGNLNTTVPFRIGAPSTAAFGPALFTGDIDEVELFKRALSPAEIWGIWRAGSNGKCRPVFDIGDMNCDGFITVGDISGFVLALTDPTQYDVQYPDCDIDLADVNGDGFVTVGDISAFVALLTGG